MRRLLFVSYYVPPRRGVGTTRARQLIRYLPEFGWDVTVLTAPLDAMQASSLKARVVETRYTDLKGAARALLGLSQHRSAHDTVGLHVARHGARRTLLQRCIEFGFTLTTYPDAQVGWIPYAVAPLRRLLKAERFDAVLSSAPPVSAHIIVAAANTRAPWVADLRDLWTGNDYYAPSGPRAFLDDRLERWALRKSTALITVSDPLAAYLRGRYPRKAVTTVPNAFDAAEWERVPFAQSKCCTILYAGDLYHGKRDPSPLFEAVRLLIDQGRIARSEISIEFYGSDEPWLVETAARHGLRDVVTCHGFVVREAVMQAERHADRLLVLLWGGEHARGIVPAKLFEYLGAARRVIAIGGPPESAIDAVFANADIGIRSSDVSTIANEVETAVIEHRAGALKRLDPAKLQEYEARTMVQSLAAVLDQAAAGSMYSARPRGSSSISRSSRSI